MDNGTHHDKSGKELKVRRSTTPAGAKGDEGGNKIRLVRGKNLHAVWH